MKRGVIYIAGVMGLVFLAAFTLPRAGRAIEARLQTEMDFALADKGLDGIEARMDGQSVIFAYNPDRAKPDDPALLAPRMTQAIMTAETLTGGLDGRQDSYGPVWGPVTRIRIDQSSLSAARISRRDEDSFALAETAP